MQTIRHIAYPNNYQTDINLKLDPFMSLVKLCNILEDGERSSRRQVPVYFNT